MNETTIMILTAMNLEYRAQPKTSKAAIREWRASSSGTP